MNPYEDPTNTRREKKRLLRERWEEAKSIGATAERKRIVKLLTNVHAEYVDNAEFHQADDEVSGVLENLITQLEADNE